ncbi:MAG: hypothetical protein DRG83_14095 [Deltaproteobacteria bacterium]|nr:MAG: hypothetical protein DRG83_14095 [Deltaproteobacteria bacterium]
MTIGIIGGGILGLTLGYHLSQAGNTVTIVEKEDKLGGLAGYIDMDGITVDKYYHGILTSDNALLQLIDELGISSKLKFKKTKMAFFHKGQTFPMTTIRDFMHFSPLTFIDRCRLGYTVVYSLLIRNWHRLEQVSVKKWLTKLSGYNAYEGIWEPLLKVKFDGDFGKIPATYIWSRVRRMASTYDRKLPKADMAYLVGGTKTLIDGLVRAIKRNGGEIYLKTPVEKVETVHGEIILRTRKGGLRFDKVISTVPIPCFLEFLPPLDGYSQALKKMPYLHLVCLVLKLKEPLSDYYFYHIADDDVPFTTVVETTNLIDPQYLKGYHIVYLPKYVKEGSPFFSMPDHEIYGDFISHLRRMFPDFRESSVEAKVVLREKYVEPVHTIGLEDSVLGISTPIDGLYMANTSQVYPSLVNCESVVAFARRVAEEIG